MSAEAASERIVLRRGAGGFGSGAGAASGGRLMRLFTAPYRLVRWFWRRWWGKLLVLLLASPFILYFLLWLMFARGLPSAESLLTISRGCRPTSATSTASRCRPSPASGGSSSLMTNSPRS